MVRQYIGARYVPKFDGVHDINKSYEPLTIVTDINAATSYTSKKTVPVGIALSDNEYWAITGTTSGAILELQNRVGVAEENIEDVQELAENTAEKVSLLKKKYVFVADSYGTFKETASNKNYIQLACEYNGLNENVDFYDFHLSGAGFSREGNQNFVEVLRNNDNVIDNKSLITDIIVLGCANDQIAASGSINNGIGSFVNYVKANYPNAKIWLSCFSKSIESDSYIKGVGPTVVTYKNAITYGCKYVNNSEYVMTWLSRYRSDLLHPNNNGVLELAKYLGMFLANGELSVHRRYEDTNLIDFRDDGWFAQGSGTTTAFMNQDNGVVELGFTLGSMARAVTTRQLSLSGETVQALNNLILKDAFFYPNNDRTFCEGFMYYGSHEYRCVYFFNNNVTTNEGFRITIAFQDINVEIPSGASVIFAMQTPYTQVLA